MLAPRDLPLLAVFLDVARAGSFTAAARKLGLSKSVVSEHVRVLEEKCRVRLVERTTRKLHPTQAGEAVLVAASAMMEAAREVDRIVRGAPGDARGHAAHRDDA
jgi:DNA-binding transcriptional LysR family regulator